MNIIESALESLSQDRLHQIARAHLESVAKRCLTNEREAIPHRLASAAEALQRLMDTRPAQEFSAKLFEETGIDARSPRFSRRGFPACTLEQWETLACSRPCTQDDWMRKG